jgi:hypothetical protein
MERLMETETGQLHNAAAAFFHNYAIFVFNNNMRNPYRVTKS